ncbi:hypothetical protein N7468_007198 [Penicillium chermesinum]|uniref:Enoyl reductase (ER) domain-containing protein n=1 Tax=Penicillium chermesinum TaxID=63820 RepID=A0A9W9NU08_9EURO|nr:uncharacterized protein N7468_007198 [Penicillium chermesinum]KAJ5225973.1 hypothetical protein N7468_007198 [Penicillium chermesinum]KAJ6160826.1 hypothetical protein N7470_004222 [Penicillium chermesinum]
MRDITPNETPQNGQTMIAVYATGGNAEDPLSVLKIGPLPQPAVPDGWARVKMSAVALNFFNIFALSGYFSEAAEYPRILGCEGTGYLDDGTPVVMYPVLGDEQYFGDETLDPNKHVISQKINGALAEYFVVPRRNILPRPAELDEVAAAVLGGSWLTAYRVIFTKSGVKPGQIMLVQGSSGGLATALIQLGTAAGIRIWVTGRTEEKRKLGLELGAERAFVPGEALPSEVASVVDISGGATWDHSIESVRPGGSIIACGAHGGLKVTMDLGQILGKQISVHSVYLGTLQEFKDLMQFVIAKKIVPKVGQIVPVSNACEAFQAMWEGRTNGKSVVTFG